MCAGGAGESTFLVECLETSAILEGATPDSVVVLDELGRGTSSFDGYAIAWATLRHLSSQASRLAACRFPRARGSFVSTALSRPGNRN